MIDSVASKGDITSGTEASRNYDGILGSKNYNITTTFGGYQNEDPDLGPYVLNAEILYTSILTYGISEASNSMKFEGTGKGIACQVRALITDLSKVTISDDN